MMLIGALLFYVLLQALSAHIWFVDVTGQVGLPGERIKAVARQYGLRPGVSKDGVDVRTVERQLLLNISEIAWVGVNLTGTRAIIEVVEKTPPKQEDRSPADIVAAKTGVITEIIAMTGQPVVNQGDTVKKGQRLISGAIVESMPPVAPGQPASLVAPPRLVRANGIVKARVWYESYGEAALVKNVYERTGRQTVGIDLQIKEHPIALKQAPAQPFALFQVEVIHKKLPSWRNSDFAVESTISIFHEIIAHSQEISWEEARDLAKGKALQTVQALIPESAQVLTRGIEILKAGEPGLVRVKVTVETIEDIGQIANMTQ